MQDRQVRIQVDVKKPRQTNRDRQRGRQTGKQTEGQTEIEAGRHPDRCESETGIKTDGQACRKAASYVNRQVDIYIFKKSHQNLKNERNLNVNLFSRMLTLNLSRPQYRPSHQLRYI